MKAGMSYDVELFMKGEAAAASLIDQGQAVLHKLSPAQEHKNGPGLAWLIRCVDHGRQSSDDRSQMALLFLMRFWPS